MDTPSHTLPIIPKNGFLYNRKFVRLLLRPLLSVWVQEDGVRGFRNPKGIPSDEFHSNPLPAEPVIAYIYISVTSYVIIVSF